MLKTCFLFILYVCVQPLNSVGRWITSHGKNCCKVKLKKQNNLVVKDLICAQSVSKSANYSDIWYPIVSIEVNSKFRDYVFDLWL